MPTANAAAPHSPVEECVICHRRAYFPVADDDGPAGCVKCGAHPCARCETPCPDDEAYCDGCASELDAESERAHHREHAMGVL